MPKLYLHSDQILPQSQTMEAHMLAQVKAKNPIMAYISSSTDKKRRYFDQKREYYSGFGVELFYVCVEEEFMKSDVEKIFKADIVFLSGGHTSHFLQLLKQRELFTPLKKYALNGGILCGVSAGAILMTPSIKIASEVPAIDRELAVKKPESLSLVNLDFYPHFGSHGSATAKELSDYAKKNRRRLIACDDGSGVAIDGDNEIHFGDVVIFS